MVKLWIFLFVLLMLVGHASAVNLVQNGDFEHNTTNNWTVAWSGDSYSVSASGTYANDTDGGIRLYLSDALGTAYLDVYQTIDFTNVDTLEFDVRILQLVQFWNPDPELDTTTRFQVFVGTTQLYSTYSTGNWNTHEYNVSAISGEQVLKFKISSYVNDVDSVEAVGEVYIDNIVADDGAPPPTINVYAKLTQSGTPMYSAGIVCGSDFAWTTENGEAFLKPEVIENKEYTMELTDNDLQDGFKLEVSALGTDVSKIIVTTDDLVASRNYDIYFDDQWIEKIGEVTEYQYDITSFSLHTLELVHATGEEEDEGGGSGPITPPPADEDEIIIEDDVITIGELTITREQFQLLTIKQIEAMNVSQDVKDELIRIKSINVNWWKILLGLCLMATVIEGSRKEGNEIVIIGGVIGVIIAAYKLGYFQL